MSDNTNTKEIAEYIIKRILTGERNIRAIKSEAALKFGSDAIVRNSDIIRIAIRLVKKKAGQNNAKRIANIIQILKRKPIRTLSGVTPVAVMIKPEGSCRWNCIYCPAAGKAAKSYTGEEPAALRARANNFDPTMQVKDRLNQFRIGGHPTSKCEIIVMGGTFLQMDEEYKQSFIKGIYDALNCNSNKRKNAKTLAEAKKINETAKCRCVGLTIETRPDVCGEKEINEMLDYGTTRVELGVQHPDDKIYKIINRGHTVEDVIRATALLKDNGFKVLYHIMPGLPDSNPKKDIEMVRELFENPEFRPDMLKIYPALVTGGTKLHEMMKHGEYTPYSSEEAADLISEFYRYIPKYVRVMRIQRDIPAGLIQGGVKKSNLRELVENKIREKGIIPKEIRWREIGLNKEKLDGKFDIRTETYSASGGTELFISYENTTSGIIAGFLRLRIPNGLIQRKEIGKNTAIVRELHVYGNEETIGKKSAKASKTAQHTGIGRALLKEAEKIAKKRFMKSEMIINSGMGVRRYYYKLGYKSKGNYVAKNL